MKLKALFTTVLAASLICANISAEAGGKVVASAPKAENGQTAVEKTEEKEPTYEDRYKAEGKTVSVVDIDLKKAYREKLKEAKGYRYIIADGNNDGIPELYILRTDENGKGYIRNEDWSKDGTYEGSLVTMVYYGYKTADSKKPELLERSVGREITVAKPGNTKAEVVVGPIDDINFKSNNKIKLDNNYDTLAPDKVKVRLYNYIVDNKNHFALESSGGISSAEQARKVHSQFGDEKYGFYGMSSTREKYFAVYNNYDVILFDYDIEGFYTPDKDMPANFFSGKRLSGLGKNPVKFHYRMPTDVLNKLKNNNLLKTYPAEDLKAFENYNFKTYYTSVDGEGGVYTAKK